MRSVPARRIAVVATVTAGLLLTSACKKADDVAAPAPSPSLSDVSASQSSPPEPTDTATAAPTGEVQPTATATRTATATKPAATTAAPRGGVFSGTRQVFLLPKNSEATLGVVPGNKIGLTSSFGDKALFVIAPTGSSGDEYSIRTAKVRAGGEPLCVSAKVGTGGKPALVLVKGCDAGAADQRFRFRQTGESNGKPTYTIRTGQNTYIVQDPTGEIAGLGTGVIAANIGEGTADIDTPFLLPDKGKATLPALD